MTKTLVNLYTRLRNGTNDAYIVWERELIEIIQNEWECDNLDAQGICEAKADLVEDGWQKNLTPFQTFCILSFKSSE